MTPTVRVRPRKAVPSPPSDGNNKYNPGAFARILDPADFGQAYYIDGDLSKTFRYWKAEDGQAFAPGDVVEVGGRLYIDDGAYTTDNYVDGAISGKTPVPDDGTEDKLWALTDEVRHLGGPSCESPDAGGTAKIGSNSDTCPRIIKLTPVFDTLYRVDYEMNKSSYEYNKYGYPTPETYFSLFLNEKETAINRSPTWGSKYSFDGWYSDKDCTAKWNFGTAIDADPKPTESIDGVNVLTLYAKWLPIVSFDLNYAGAAPTPPPQTLPAGGTATEPAPPPSRGSYVFGGWYTQKECDGTAYNFNTPVTEPITLYAKWSEGGGYQVKFLLNGGEKPEAWDSWYDEADGDEADGWTLKETVTDADTGVITGILIESDAGTGTCKVKAPSPKPYKSGYTFQGWFIAADEDGTLGSNAKLWNFNDDMQTDENGVSAEGELVLIARWADLLQLR
jgi:uncharacterized repeat protein (TIGR02543 family)